MLAEPISHQFEIRSVNSALALVEWLHGSCRTCHDEFERAGALETNTELATTGDSRISNCKSALETHGSKQVL